MFDLFWHFHLHVFQFEFDFLDNDIKVNPLCGATLAISDNNIHEAGEGKITPHSLDRSQSPITV